MDGVNGSDKSEGQVATDMDIDQVDKIGSSETDVTDKETASQKLKVDDGGGDGQKVDQVEGSDAEVAVADKDTESQKVDNEELYEKVDKVLSNGTADEPAGNSNGDSSSKDADAVVKPEPEIEAGEIDDKGKGKEKEKEKSPEPEPIPEDKDLIIEIKNDYHCLICYKLIYEVTKLNSVTGLIEDDKDDEKKDYFLSTDCHSQSLVKLLGLPVSYITEHLRDTKLCGDCGTWMLQTLETLDELKFLQEKVMNAKKRAIQLISVSYIHQSQNLIESDPNFEKCDRTKQAREVIFDKLGDLGIVKKRKPDPEPEVEPPPSIKSEVKDEPEAKLVATPTPNANIKQTGRKRGRKPAAAAEPAAPTPPPEPVIKEENNVDAATNGPMFTCRICQFQVPQSFTWCHKCKTGEMQFPCQFCDKIYKSCMGLKNHEKANCAATSAKKGSVSPNKVGQKRKRSSGVGTYECEYCPAKRFRTKSAYSQHIKQHADSEEEEEENESEVESESEAEAEPVTEVIIDTAVQEESDEEVEENGEGSGSGSDEEESEDGIDLPFKCDTCPFQFDNERSLTAHRERDHLIRGYKCKVLSCQKMFREPRFLELHEKTHEKDAPPQLQLVSSPSVSYSQNRRGRPRRN